MMDSIPTATRGCRVPSRIPTAPMLCHLWLAETWSDKVSRIWRLRCKTTAVIYNVIYTYTKGSWIIQPYFQYTDVPTNAQIGVVKGASTKGGAILLSHAFKHGFSLPGAGNISRARVALLRTVNLMYGPGSGGMVRHCDAHLSIRRLLRSRRSFVGPRDQLHAGLRLRSDGVNDNQSERAEIGFVFGNNVVEKTKRAGGLNLRAAYFTNARWAQLSHRRSG